MCEDGSALARVLLAKKIAEAKEAFILEELKPYCDCIDIATGEIIWSQKLRLRLAEYKDWKRQFEQEKKQIMTKLIDELFLYVNKGQPFNESKMREVACIVGKCFGVLE